MGRFSPSVHRYVVQMDIAFPRQGLRPRGGLAQFQAKIFAAKKAGKIRWLFSRKYESLSLFRQADPGSNLPKVPKPL
jgi:hypothetical protein